MERRSLRAGGCRESGGPAARCCRANTSAPMPAASRVVLQAFNFEPTDRVASPPSLHFKRSINTTSTIDCLQEPIFGYWEAWAQGVGIHCLKTHLGRSGPWLGAYPPGCPL